MTESLDTHQAYSALADAIRAGVDGMGLGEIFAKHGVTNKVAFSELFSSMPEGAPRLSVIALEAGNLYALNALVDIEKRFSVPAAPALEEIAGRADEKLFLLLETIMKTNHYTVLSQFHQDEAGNGIEHYAAYYANASLIALRAEQYPENFCRSNKEGDTPLILYLKGAQARTENLVMGEDLAIVSFLDQLLKNKPEENLDIPAVIIKNNPNVPKLEAIELATEQEMDSTQKFLKARMTDIDKFLSSAIDTIEKLPDNSQYYRKYAVTFKFRTDEMGDKLLDETIASQLKSQLEKLPHKSSIHLDQKEGKFLIETFDNPAISAALDDVVHAKALSRQHGMGRGRF